VFTTGIDYERVYRHLDNFLYFQKCNCPSQMFGVYKFHSEFLEEYFFSEVCVSNVIDSLMILDSPEKVIGERYAILEYLTAVLKFKKHKYEIEKDYLIKELILMQSLDEISVGKININKSQIKNIVEKHVAKFINYFNLTPSNVTFRSFIDSDVQDVVVEILEQDISFEGFKDVPLKALFLEGVFKIIREAYLNDPYFGLDSCLSVRVRHTVIKSFMKGFFSKTHLISSIGEDDLRIDHDYWRNYYSENSLGVSFEKIMIIFEQFRTRINDYLDIIKQKKIHIYSECNTEGIFNFELDHAEILRITNELGTSSEVSFEQVFESLYELLESQLKEQLKIVRVFFKEDVSKCLKAELLEFETKIRHEDVDNAIASAIRQCKSEIDSNMEQIARWFDFENEEQYSDFYVEEFFERYKLAYESLIPGLNISITLCKEGIPVLVNGKYKSKVIDIYNNVIANILKRSGQVLSIKFRINIFYKDDIVDIEFINDCDSSQRDEIDRNLEKSRKAIAEFNANSLMIKDEGGTGFLKIENILKNHISSSSLLSFDYKNDVFTTSISLCGLGVLRKVQ